MLATKKGHFEIVTALLKAKANPNITEKVCIKRSSHHHSVNSCNVVYVIFISSLLQDAGWNALYFAVQEDHIDIVRLLIGYGCSVDFKDKVRSVTFIIIILFTL